MKPEEAAEAYAIRYGKALYQERWPDSLTVAEREHVTDVKVHYWNGYAKRHADLAAEMLEEMERWCKEHCYYEADCLHEHMKQKFGGAL